MNESEYGGEIWNRSTFKARGGGETSAWFQTLTFASNEVHPNLLDEFSAESVDGEASHIVVVAIDPLHKAAANHLLDAIPSSLIPTIAKLKENKSQIVAKWGNCSQKNHRRIVSARTSGFQFLHTPQSCPE